MSKELLDTPGKRLRALRISTGLTQRDVADRLGVTASYVSRMECDSANLYPKAVMLADLLGTTIDYLIMRSDVVWPQHAAEQPQGEAAPRETNDQRMLRLLMEAVPEHRRPLLMRYMIKQVTFFTELFLEG